MNYLPNGENDLAEYQAQPIPIYQPRKRVNVGKWLFLAALGSIGVFCFLALPEANTAAPADDYQEAIDAVQLDNVENEQLLQVMASNSNINTLNDISAQATRSAYQVDTERARLMMNIEAMATQSAVDIGGQVALINAQIRLTDAQLAHVASARQANRETVQDWSWFAVVIALLTTAVVLIVKYQPAKAEPQGVEDAPKLAAGDDPAMIEFARLVEELVARMDAKERETAVNIDNSPIITRNSPNYDIKPRVMPHLAALERVGLTHEQIGRLPFRAADLTDGVPVWAVDAMRQLHNDGMVKSVISPLFGLNGSKNKLFQEVMK